MDTAARAVFQSVHIGGLTKARYSPSFRHSQSCIPKLIYGCPDACREVQRTVQASGSRVRMAAWLGFPSRPRKSKDTASSQRFGSIRRPDVGESARRFWRIVSTCARRKR